MTAELPRCAVCRVQLDPGRNVVFRRDGRVQHTECPEVLCLLCSLPVVPKEPIRRDREQRIAHANCWMRMLRTPSR